MEEEAGEEDEASGSQQEAGTEEVGGDMEEKEGAKVSGTDAEVKVEQCREKTPCKYCGKNETCLIYKTVFKNGK